MSFELSDDTARLDIGRIHGWLASSYWSPGIERDLVERAIKRSHCLGVYRKAEQVGFARAITDHATFAWIADVWVDESARGQGLGQRMLQALLRIARAQHAQRVFLEVRPSNPRAITLYDRSGFNEIGRRPRYYPAHHGREDAIVMAMELLD